MTSRVSGATARHTSALCIEQQPRVFAKATGVVVHDSLRVAEGLEQWADLAVRSYNTGHLQDLLLQVGAIASRLAELNDMVDHQLRGLRLARATLTAGM